MCLENVTLSIIQIVIFVYCSAAFSLSFTNSQVDSTWEKSMHLFLFCVCVMRLLEKSLRWRFVNGRSIWQPCEWGHRAFAMKGDLVGELKKENSGNKCDLLFALTIAFSILHTLHHTLNTVYLHYH